MRLFSLRIESGSMKRTKNWSAYTSQERKKRLWENEKRTTEWKETLSHIGSQR